MIKVYTCVSESVLAQYIPFSETKYKFYKDAEVPYPALEMIKRNLSGLKERVILIYLIKVPEF